MPTDHNPVNHGQNAGGGGGNDNNDAGWGPWDEAIAAQKDQLHEPKVQGAQDQNSMVLNPSMGSNSSSDDQSADVEAV